MDYIIINLHSTMCNNLVTKIKKAINPYIIIQSGILPLTRTSYDYTKLNQYNPGEVILQNNITNRLSPNIGTGIYF